MAHLHVRLDFPFNLYAQALILERGRVKDLHYGLFEHPDQDLEEAQQASTDLLVSLLPRPPLDVLESGIGLGATFTRLLEAGHRVTGITPDAEQVRHVAEACAAFPTANVLQRRFEDIGDLVGAFDVILFQESAQYIQAHVLLEVAARVLRPNGRVVILDELTLAIFKHAADFARHFGFELLRHDDLTSRAAPTVDLLLRVISKHRAELAERLSLPLATIDAILCELEDRSTAYRRGLYRYALLELTKVADPVPAMFRRGR